MSVQNPSNPKNRFDFQGQRHMDISNSVVDNYGDQIVAIQTTEERESFITSTVQDTARSMYGIDEDPYQYYNTILGYQGLISTIDFASQYRDIAQAFTTASDYAKQQLISLYDSLVNQPLATDDDVQMALNRMIDFENQVASTGDEQLLTAIAISKFSLYGWWKTPPYNPAPDPTPTAKINWGGVICDGLGGLGGGLVGACAASGCYWYCTN